MAITGPGPEVPGPAAGGRHRGPQGRASRRRAETDEPESLGADRDGQAGGRSGKTSLRSTANLQRLDGPGRGNSKIIQELEGHSAGAGWNVITDHLGQRLGPVDRRDSSWALPSAWRKPSTGEFQDFSQNGA